MIETVLIDRLLVDAFAFDDLNALQMPAALLLEVAAFDGDLSDSTDVGPAIGEDIGGFGVEWNGAALRVRQWDCHEVMLAANLQHHGSLEASLARDGLDRVVNV